MGVSHSTYGAAQGLVTFRRLFIRINPLAQDVSDREGGDGGLDVFRIEPVPEGLEHVLSCQYSLGSTIVMSAVWLSGIGRLPKI